MAAGLAACATGAPAGSAPLALETDVVIHDHPLTLHLSLVPHHATSPLILYATGDGGWFGSDKALFNEVARWGYPAAGFSARDYVTHLGDGVTALPVEEVAADFARLIRTAAAALGLPDATRVVLVGKSRGAGLDVAVAGQPALRARLQGVIAIGLTREEEYVATRAADGSAKMLLTYPALPPIGADVPVAVIQSTHDDYVPAAEARTLFGPDTPSRTLRPIDSTDHNFGGAVPDLYREMTSCFDWILHQ
jgi:fermentation-respiration switch protein FrsA (DUF1100 family)